MYLANVKITVVKKIDNQDVIEKYGNPTRTDLKECPLLNVGDELFVKDMTIPEGFCSWAWSDIIRDVALLSFGGNAGNVNKKGTFITSCTDGFRPVIFRLERVEE